MIRYAPFLGQVPLVVGQAVVVPEDPRRRDIADLRRQIQATDMRPGVRQALVEKVNSCESMLSIAVNVEELLNVDKCIEETKYVLASPMLPFLSTREETEKQAAAFEASRGLPTWAYVVGALAAAGVVGWLIFGK